MATLRWIGAAANIRQVDDVDFALTWASADTASIVIDNVAFTVVTGAAATATAAATTLYQAFEAVALTDTGAAASPISVADGGGKSIPQFSEFTATNPSAGKVRFTQSVSGSKACKPIVMTATETTAGNGTATLTNVTAATGQHFASQVDNFTGNVQLADGDTLVFDDGAVDMLYKLNTYTSGGSTCQLAAITKTKKYTGNVGLAETNADNSSKLYHEYRTPTYFTTDDNTAITTANLETGEGPGSSRFKWDAGAGQCIVNVFGSGPVQDNIPPLLWKGTHASNVVNNIAGNIGIAYYAGESATVVTLVTGDGPQSNAKTFCGSGCTLTTVTLNGGFQETNSAITTAAQNGGKWNHKLGTVTTANINAGEHYPLGGATYTTLNLYGTFDCTKGTASFVITNTIQLYKGAKFIDPQGRAGNIVFKLNGCNLEDVTIITPFNKTFTLS
jgi:hypothetical protein